MEEDRLDVLVKWAVLAIVAGFGVVLQYLHLGSFTAPILAGHKTVALLDLWVPSHLAGGVAIAFLCRPFLDKKDHPGSWLQGMLAWAFIWEDSEFCLEALNDLFGGALVAWHAGVEHWSNRFLVDPLCLVLGGLAYRRWPWLAKPAIAYWLVWEAINVLSPDCMHIQETLFSFL